MNQETDFECFDDLTDGRILAKEHRQKTELMSLFFSYKRHSKFVLAFLVSSNKVDHHFLAFFCFCIFFFVHFLSDLVSKSYRN